MSKIQIYQEEVDLDSFDDSGLPTDIHMVHFTKEDGTEQVDAVRAYTMVDIFDVYHDKLKGSGRVVRIKNGFGSIRPNLWNTSKGEKSDE